MSESGYARESSTTPIDDYHFSTGQVDEQLKQEPRPLNPRQVEKAMKMVNMRHPLRKTPLWKTLPYLAPLEKWLPQTVVDWANGR